MTPRPADIGNLPREMTSFVGRRVEMDGVKRLLGDHRLVTLTGVGGTGKTRVARRVGAQLRPGLPGGVWFVDLSTALEPQFAQHEDHGLPQVMPLVATTLGVRERPAGPPLLELLTDHLARHRLLLILDNCEHVLETCAALAVALLWACPDVRILATSREPLGVYGEVRFVVPPLSLPDPSQPRWLSDCESVALFLARARRAVPGFQLAGANQQAVATICRRLEGLPLGIELAAAALRTLSPQQILERLVDRFAELGPAGKRAPDHQQTLRACIDWSYELCTMPERRLWAALSVFAGGFDLEAVEGVCADDNLPAHDVLDLVAALLDKSILTRDDDGERAGYRMLDIIRDYGHERLLESGEESRVGRHHRDWCQQLTARARDEWISDKQGYWLARLRREHHNLRVAIQYCLTQPGQADAALRLLVTVPRVYWPAQGLVGEARRWLDRALALATAPTAIRVRALMTASRLAFTHGDVPAGTRLLHEGCELTQRLDDTAGLAVASLIEGVNALFYGDLSAAVDSLRHAWTCQSRDPQPDLDQHLDVLFLYGLAAALTGDPDRVAACRAEILAITEPRGECVYRSAAIWTEALSAWLRVDLHAAAAHVLTSLRVQADGLRDRYGSGLCLELLAWIRASQGLPWRSATLLGATNAMLTELNVSLTTYGYLVGYHNQCEQQVRASLGEETFAEAFQHGRALLYEEALACAFDDSPTTQSASGAAQPAPGGSPRASAAPALGSDSTEPLPGFDCGRSRAAVFRGCPAIRK